MAKRKLTGILLSGAVLWASLMAVSHVHLPPAGPEAQTSDVASLTCGCISHNSKTDPSGEPTPGNDEDCHLCKLLTQFSGATVVLNLLTVELNQQQFLQKLETLKPVGIQRAYQVRGPPIIVG